MTKIAKDVTRTPLTHIPKDVATRVLAEPKNKLSNKSRKRFLHARGSRVEVEVADATSVQDKYCRKLRTISLHSLAKQRVQAGKQIWRLFKILNVLDRNAKQRPALEQAHTLQLYRKSWIDDEIARRCTAKPVLPKKVAFPTVAEYLKDVCLNDIGNGGAYDYDHDVSKDDAPHETSQGYLNPDGN